MTRSFRTTSALMVVLLVLALSACSLFKGKPEEVLLGQYVTPPEPEVDPGTVLSWVFENLPDTSAVTQFLPSDTSAMVAFKPDVPGTYEIRLIKTQGGKTKEELFVFEVNMPEDGEPLMEAPPEEIAAFIAAQAETLEADLPTTIPETGERREYLSKLVTPQKTTAPATPVKRKATPRPKPKRTVAPAEPNRADLIPKATKTYTIQVAAWPSLADAQIASEQLLEQYGIDNYIQRAFFKDRDEVYYRIRVGNFEKFSEANTYAKEIRDLTSLPAWVDFVRQEM